MVKKSRNTKILKMYFFYWVKKCIDKVKLIVCNILFYFFKQLPLHKLIIFQLTHNMLKFTQKMKEKAELPSHLRLQNLCGKATSLQILAKTN